MRNTLVRLRGAGGEPVDLRRTVRSHGLTDLPPLSRHADDRGFDVVLPLPRGRPVRATVREAGPDEAAVSFAKDISPAAQDHAVATVRHMLRLDDDLSSFYALAAEDERLAWVVSGAGRLMRSPTVFEDVVKTLCTTNCAWSGTVRMVTQLVHGLGAPARGEPADTVRRAFPTPQAMADAPESWYAEVARAGYRGPYLRALAEQVASGELDLEALGAASREELPDDELEARLLALAGIGPYAAAHIMLLIGRQSRLVLDSWTRPTWARINGRKAADPAIVRRFRRYGEHAGLAFWLRLTEDWVEADPPYPA